MKTIILRFTGGLLATVAGVLVFNTDRSAAIIAFAAATTVFATIVLDRNRERK